MPVPALVLRSVLTYVGTQIVDEVIGDAFDWLVGQAGKAACNAYLYSPVAGSGAPIIDSAMTSMCGGYWGQDGPYALPNAVPFTGGQCDKLYNVYYGTEFRSEDSRCVDPPGTGPYCSTSYPGQAQFGVRGPIKAPVYSRGPNGEGCIEWYGKTQTSQNRIIDGCTQAIGTYTVTDVSVVPQSGLDNCGNPAPVSRPNADTPGPGRWGEVNIVIQPETNIRVPITPFAPTINIDGSISLNVDVGGITIDLFGGGGSGGGGGGGGTPPSGGGGAGGGTPIVGGGPGAPGEETFPDPPEGKEWIGCVLELEIPEAYGKIVGTAPAEVMPRTIGNARLVYETSDLNFDGFVAPNHQIREAALTLIRQHRGLKVVGVYVNIPEDVSVLITPIYVDIETVTTD